MENNIVLKFPAVQGLKLCRSELINHRIAQRNTEFSFPNLALVNLYNHLKNLLHQHQKFCKDNRLFRNIIVEAALKLDPELLTILLSDQTTKQYFFAEVNGITIFDKVKFQNFVDNKQFLPDSFTAFKNKIGLTAEGKYLTAARAVVLDFPYKDCVLEGGQTKDDQKRKEIFWNETLAPDEIDRLFEPKVLTHWKRYDQDGEHEVKHLSLKDNLILKGNNLIALHSLKKIYKGKVKLIYIDPPYNTGGDANIFTYNNTFNHSTWLTFMKNRLEVAKQLLTEDGFMVIAIDHCELGYLIVLADEIFGRANRLGIVTVVHNAGGRPDATFFSVSNEYMLVYAKNQDYATLKNFDLSHEKRKDYKYKDNKGFYKLDIFHRASHNSNREDRPNLFYPLYYDLINNELSMTKTEKSVEIFPIDNNGNEKCWRWSKKRTSENIDELVIRKIKHRYRIFAKSRLENSKGEKPKTFWNDSKYSGSSGSILLSKLLGQSKIFSYPKSLHTVLDTVKIMTNKNDLILDFFAGSGTTGHAVLELNKQDGGNRKFILIEQLDHHIDICRQRNQKVLQQENINASFVYCELKANTAHYKSKIAQADQNQVLKLWQELKANPHVSYRVDFQMTADQAFQDLSLDDQKEILQSLLDKNMLYVPYADLEDEDYKIAKSDQNLTNLFYNLA